MIRIMIFIGGEINWDLSNWSMSYWNNFWTAFGAMSALLAIVAGTFWVWYQIKATKRQMLYSHKEEAIVFLKMIISDYEESIHRSYMFVPNMEPDIYLNKTIWYSTVNLFNTKRMNEIRNFLIERNKKESDQEKLDRQIDTKVNAEILYIEKMRQHIYVSFKNKANAKQMRNFLDNYIKVISSYLFLFKFHNGSNDDTFDSIFEDLKALPKIADMYDIKTLKQQIGELDIVFQDREKIISKLDRELKRI